LRRAGSGRGGLLLGRQLGAVGLDEGHDVSLGSEEPLPLLAVQRDGEPSHAVDREGTLLAHLVGERVALDVLRLERCVFGFEAGELLFDGFHVGDSFVVSLRCFVNGSVAVSELER
jgi:hypothetical protein